jgi:lactate dehydrogenase-like 2-hydroxyacid dehydrogenase
MRLADFDVLMPAQGIAAVGKLIAARLPLHEVSPDDARAFAKIAPRIRAIAATTHTVKIDASLMRRLPNLEIVASIGVGYDHIDAAWAGRHGVIVTHTPGVLDDEVADVAIALTISAVRKLPQAERYLREGLWAKGHYPLTASLRGRTMGILGLGRIGKSIASRAEAFGLKVVYHGRSIQAGARYLYYPTLLGMAQDCDILVIAAPGGAGTRHVVNAEVLAALGPNGVLVNIARGSLVDEDALIAALQNGTILAAGLDVFANEPHVPEALLALDNAVLLPHVGSASNQTREAMARLTAENLFSFAAGSGPLTPVPETPWPVRRA